MTAGERRCAILVVLLAGSMAILCTRPWRHLRVASDSSDVRHIGARQADETAPVGLVDNVTSEQACVADYSAYQRTSGYDPGTVRAFLRNRSRQSIEIRRIVLDDAPLLVWGLDLTVLNMNAEGQINPASPAYKQFQEQREAERLPGRRIVWARISDSTISPGTTAELAVKLANPLTRPCKLDFSFADGTRKILVVRPDVPPMVFSAVTFTPDYGRMFLYMESASEKPLRISDILLNGQPVRDGLWLSSQVVEKGEKQLAVIDLHPPLTPGACLNIAACADDGIPAMTRVRAFSGFPINTSAGGRAADMGLDDREYALTPSYVSTAHAPPASPSASPQGNGIFQCAMHEYGGDTERCAREIFRRYDLCRKFDPTHPCFVHMCRTNPELGYPLFAETFDILHTNPNVHNSLSSKSLLPEESVEALTRHACLSARPRPVHCEMDVRAFGDNRSVASPDELLRRTYTILGCGAKGLFYRNLDGNTTESLARKLTIRNINSVMRKARDLLTIADTVSWARVDQAEDTTVYPLLAGDRAVLVCVVQHGRRAVQVPVELRKENASANAGEERSHITVTLPPWLRVKDVARISPDNDTPLAFKCDKTGEVSFDLEKTVPAALVVLRTERTDSSGNLP